MRKRTIFIGLGAAVLLALGAAAAMLAVTREPAEVATPAAVPLSDQQALIEGLKPPKRSRPAIAILGLNDSTEVSDFLTSYGVLRESGVADVTVVAEKATPIRLYPALEVKPQATMLEFEARYPDGADYVVVPAMEPRNDPGILAWLKSQHAKGAKIVSICNGSKTLAAAGLLAGRNATGHWNDIRQLQADHPTMHWVHDRRYVVDRGIATSTGISASIPLTIALVEAIGGRAEADRLAAKLGVTNWDARHLTSAFQVTRDHKRTWLRNTLAFWRHETLGVPLADQTDEIALGLILDAYSRTQLSNVATMAKGDGFIQTRRGLSIRPDHASGLASIDAELPPLQSEEPGRTLDREFERIGARYDRATAAFVALTMEYAWPRRDTSH